MSDRPLPQRWNEPAPSVADPHTTGGPGRTDQESALKVVLELLRLARRNWKVVLATSLASLALLFLQLKYDHPVYRATAVVRFDDKGRALSNGLSAGPARQMGGG